ncbi:phage baseplate assembly protein V [Sulfurimonas sp.]|uniref:phage baseplate assembly protein V n=1 Tax=Sulfurimonas sp. TaxID=2022749 RepID=UPI0025ED6245|nr:phage baseplate assembly protein V [Sulfurimonas sp.]
MKLSEILRKLNNIVQIGTISQTKSKDGKALARVILDEDGDEKRVTAFLPVISLANSFARIFIPLRVNEQVLVLSPFGNANRGFILRSIFNRGCKEPSEANENTAVIEFKDGTKLTYDTKANVLKIDAVKTINIFCVDANIKATTVYVKADNTTIESTTLVKGTLTVTDLFSANGGMKVQPSADGAVAAEFNCDIKTKKKIFDEKGNVTDHSHSCSDGATAQPR